MPEHLTPNEVGEFLDPPGPRPAVGHPPADGEPGRALSGFGAAQSPDDRARDECRRTITDGVLRMAAKAGVELHTVDLQGDGLFTHQEPDPADGIRYARMLRDAATQQEHRFLQRARQTGQTWREIGVILGLEDEARQTGADLAALAWQYAAGWDENNLYERVSFLWTCPACRGFIYDRGAFGEHPADEEEGHKAGCGRLAAASAAYEARFDE